MAPISRKLVYDLQTSSAAKKRLSEKRCNIVARLRNIKSGKSKGTKRKKRVAKNEGNDDDSSSKENNNSNDKQVAAAATPATSQAWNDTQAEPQPQPPPPPTVVQVEKWHPGETYGYGGFSFNLDIPNVLAQFGEDTERTVDPEDF